MRCIIKNNSIIRRSILASCFLLLASCFLAIYPTKALGQMIDCADPQEDHPEVPYKCLNLQNNQVYTITICGNEIPQMGCNDCCFTLEYCWRWIPPSQPGYNDDRFDVLFKKITYSGTTSDCWKCARENYDLLVEMLHKKILIAHVAEHNIDGNTKEYNHLVLRSACTRFDGTEYVDCGKGKGCCYRTYQIGMIGYPPYSFTDYNQQGTPQYYGFIPNCAPPPSGCEKKCGFIEGIPLIPDCDIDCIFTSYTPENPITIPYPIYPYCPFCNIIVYYDVRRVLPGCPNNWKDFRINRIETDAGCDGCYFSSETWQDMMETAIRYVLLGGMHSLPREGETFTDYRIIFLPCWKNVDGVLVQCHSESCCISVYDITKEDGEFIITFKYRTNVVTNCEDPDPNCVLFCVEPVKNEKDKKDINHILNNSNSFTIPNPVQDKIEIHYISDFIGNIKIEIYNNNGNLVLNKVYTKNVNELVMNLKISDFTNGSYRYIIKSGLNKLSDGSFIIK